ncbi:MAG TPA: methyltransferase [Candidatus Polarisedimenticolia bacterium]|nr:methyltransferase [Candidatus Polarisedimenticolia bacterium]
MSASSAHSAETPALAGQLLQIITGYMPAVSLHAAAKLKIADLLAGGPKPVSELAREAQGVNEGALYRVLRGLASVGVFSETSPRTFANTPASDLLREGVPGSVRDIALWLGNPLHMRVFAETLYSVETGNTALKKVTGFETFDYFKHHPAEDEVFNAAMTGFSAMLTPPVLEAYDFGGLGTLADIGGGHGFLLSAILQKHPGLRGIVCDLPHVVAGAKPRLESLGLASRCEIASADFFKAVPPADSYVMKSVIHDWDDARAIAILKNCAAAMRGSNGKVILLELVVYPGNDPDIGKWIDLEMLLMAGGHERTEAEYAELFSQAGLRLSRVVRTKSPMCVVEAVKA